MEGILFSYFYIFNLFSVINGWLGLMDGPTRTDRSDGYGARSDPTINSDLFATLCSFPVLTKACNRVPQLTYRAPPVQTKLGSRLVTSASRGLLSARNGYPRLIQWKVDHPTTAEGCLTPNRRSKQTARRGYLIRVPVEVSARSSLVQSTVQLIEPQN